MDVVLSLATGLGLRVFLIRSTSPTSLIAPAVLGLWEGILVHQLSFHPPPSASSPPIDHYLAFGLRLLIELLIANNRSRVTVTALWAAIGAIISESVFPSLLANFTSSHHTPSGRRNHEKRRQHSRAVPSHIPSHVRMYKEPEGSPRPLPFRAPQPHTSTPNIQINTTVAQNDEVLVSPNFASTPPSFYLHADAEPSPFPDSPASLNPNVTTTVVSSIPLRPSSALAFYERENGVPNDPSSGEPLRPPNLPTPPDSTFRERTMDSRVDRLSTIDEITSRSEHVSEDVVQGEVEGEENYILISHGGVVPLPVPNSTSHYVHADDTAAIGSAVPSSTPSTQRATPTLIAIPIPYRPRTPSEDGDELRTPRNHVYGIDSDPDELTTPPHLRASADEGDTAASTPRRGNGSTRPESRLSPLMLDTQAVAPDPEPIAIPGARLSSYTFLQTPVAPAPLGSLLDTLTLSGPAPGPEIEQLLSSPSNNSAAESVLSSRIPRKLLERAEELRKQANLEASESARLEKEESLARSQKRGLDALFLRGDIRDAEERSRKLHEKAARRHFAARNDNPRKQYTIDVHGLKPQEALQKTEQVFRDLLKNGHSTLKVIVGKGNHSAGGIPVVKNHILREMQRRHIPCVVDPSNSGVLILRLTPETGTSGNVV